ncbi:uncharacterized protein LOC106876488 [Octopus bimaculoides]|uniref:uncharacterized protein LOC106876488 n=1 Tax=Octopus bimaculoides TaxID=37653 RepID=UPI00071E2BF2|nr:uncharacterized protein LOC106876488 [Octopus bimaculoides]|eukprot:XP_014780537.1 PREDICTED: uncharacterized protein LOC106876488 [Octopus bimaculoides]
MLSNLPPPLSNEIRDLVDPTEPFSYSSVKKEILKRSSNSKQKEFAKLFNNEQLGNRKPTQLLRRMKELGNQQIGESYLKKVFFCKLPHSTQTLLSAVKEQRFLKQLVDLADGIMELSSRESVNALPSISSELQLMKEIYEIQFKLLTDKIESLQLGRDKRSYKRNNARWRRRSKSPERNAICWYHSKFDDKSYRCIKPCSFDFLNKKRSRNFSTTD